jgi:pimeloyl-ACP methyl ester carboxylesterase
MTQTPSFPRTNGKVRVNDVELYFEVYGTGEPLLMLHGGVNPSEMFGAPLAEMAKTRQVVALHMRGHGFSSDTLYPWTYEQMADDVAAALHEIGAAKVDVMGYSLGGGVALQTAIRHPEVVNKLIVISMAFRADGGDYPEIRAAFESMPSDAPSLGKAIAASPLATTYPDVNWTTMMLKTGQMNQPSHDWSNEVAQIASPMLIMFADADSIMLEHMVEFYKLLGGGQRDGGMDGSGRSKHQLAIIPNRTHYNILTHPAVTQFAEQFLAAE